MKFWMYILMLTYQCYCHTILPKIISSRNSTIYTLLENSNSSNLSRFVVIPNVDNQNIDETLYAEFQSFTNKLFLQENNEWSLSVRLNQQFFYNNEPNQIIHVLCYLQFNIENSSRFVGSQTNCVTMLNWHGQNISQSSSCEIKIGRSPGFCSTHFDITGLIFNEKSPTWGSITAQLSLNSNYPLANSFNSMPVVFNHRKPVNWTVVQQHSHFGQLSLGLPITSVKAGTYFLLPLSISETEDISQIRMLFEYDSCLSLNNIEVQDKKRWQLKTNFEHSESKESGVIRLSSEKRFIESNTSNDWPIVTVSLNFTVVTDKRPTTSAGTSTGYDCTIKAGISRVDLISGGHSKYFNKISFIKDDHKSVPIAIDPDKMDLISFKESMDKKVQLFSSDISYSFPISTYLIQQQGESYLPTLVTTSTCSNTKCQGYVPQKIANSWLLPVTIQHWRTVLYNLENRWQPDGWTLHVSDTELNPISDWRVPHMAGSNCLTMYQSARLKIGVRLLSINSMGLKSYLGGTVTEPDPWIEVTSEMVTAFKVTSDPPDIVSLSRSESGSFVISVNKSGSTTLQLRDRTGHDILASRTITVFTSHWASVTAVTGRCIANVSLRVAESHPVSDGEYVAVDLTSGRLRPGDKCRLVLMVLFNDGATMALDDVDARWYSVTVDGASLSRDAMIRYRRSVAVELREARRCGDQRIVFRGVVDLSRDVADDQWTVTTVATVTAAVTERTRPAVVAVVATLPMTAVIAGCVLLALTAVTVAVVTLHCVLRRRHRRGKSTATMTPLDREPYPSLLPPPGPIVLPSGKHPSEWAAASSDSSGLGADHCSSSIGSRHDPPGCIGGIGNCGGGGGGGGMPLCSTFRGSGRHSDSSSSCVVRQTSPISDPIIDSISDSSLLFDHRQSPHGCYWPLVNGHRPPSSSMLSAMPPTVTITDISHHSHQYHQDNRL